MAVIDLSISWWFAISQIYIKWIHQIYNNSFYDSPFFEGIRNITERKYCKMCKYFTNIHIRVAYKLI